MRVLQFAKRSVVTVALVSMSLAGCGGESTPDAPFNPTGTTADLQAMNSTFASPTFASFSTFSIMFDAALGGAPIISASTGALDIRGKTPQGIRAAAVRTAQRLAATLRPTTGAGMSTSSSTHPGQALAAVPPEVAGKTFIYDPVTGSYAASTRTGAPSNGVRFILYAVDPVSYMPVEPLTETGHVDLTDLSAGSTQAARVVVVSGGTTYIDYTVSASSTATTGRVSVNGMVTDGAIQATVNLLSTVTYTGGLTLTYALDVPQRDVSIDLTITASNISQPTGTIMINLLMRGPNGTVAMTGEFEETNGTIQVRINGSAFATITTDGVTTTITRSDGTAPTDEEYVALQGVFEIQAGAFIAFDSMLAPVGAFFDEPA
ncbi:MAG TPA: hypothetical protein VFH24_02975 [Gemmatimonadales bacterium]|nr:hypothetical protein [Gemmatimonadales bacterium]